MSALWSAEQQAWLAALGHRVLVLAGDETASPMFDMPAIREPVASAPTAGSAASTVARGADAPPGLGRPSHATDARGARVAGTPERRPAPQDAPKAAPPASRASRPASPRGPDDALERAVLRVTGQRTRSEARAVLERLGVDVQALRGNPAAKRALWRQLRPLQPRFRP